MLNNRKLSQIVYLTKGNPADSPTPNDIGLIQLCQSIHSGTRVVNSLVLVQLDP